MTKAQERAREIAEAKTLELYGDCMSYKLTRDGFWDAVFRACLAAYAQGQRDLVEDARGIRRWMINLKDLAELAGVE